MMAISDSVDSSAVAIVGFAFRFPGDLADDSALWLALKEKRDLISRVPSDRWATNELEHTSRSEPGRSITFSAGVLSGVDQFDAGFFGISPREAAMLDPQQRLLLELSWEAMENAGVPPSALSGTNCAVYVGISSLDYGTRWLDDLAAMTSHSMTGSTLSIAANRLSYAFDLRGPSVAIDTACSSSVVALHHACQALRFGEASAALVGGVNLLLHPYPFVGFTKASMLSADGRCKPFDASGSGYVRAEGGAVLLLKPLAQALNDGDDIQAIVLATGVNSDGALKTAITIPSRDGQVELIRRVLEKSGLTEQDVDFFEAHGTGTKVGDPVETAAIGAVYGQRRKTPLPIGSIKSNLGHLEAASGMAGLVKTILALQRRGLPPQLHLETPNPQIDFIGLGLQPVDEYLPLEKEGPLVAGVNSFGFGGTNGHALLQEYPKVATQDAPQTDDVLPPMVLSARSDAALRSLAARYSAQLTKTTRSDYYDIAYAAYKRRERLEKRLALYAESPEEAAQKLAAYARGEVPGGLVKEESLSQQGGIAFIYSGNGAQWVGMGVRLMAESPKFNEILAELDLCLRPVAGFSLLAELQAAGPASRLDDTVVAQPLLFAIQVAITRFLKLQGIEPQAVCGHSVGEVAAAWAAGALDLEAAIRVIVARSHAQGVTRGTGRMAAVGLSLESMQAIILELGEGLDIAIAGINSPKNLTLAGDLEDLDRIQSYLADKGVFYRLLDLDYAFHSHHMDTVRGPLLANLENLQASATGGKVFVSTVTGGVLAGTELGAEYWWRNVREPVRFCESIATLCNLGCRIFIEIGPHSILQRYINESISSLGFQGRVLPSSRREADGQSALVEVALSAHLLANTQDLRAYFPHSGRRIRLPNYPWQRERHWHGRTTESLLTTERRRVHPLLGWRVPEAAYIWENTLDPKVLPWLADHQVGGATVFPGSAYAEMALAASYEWHGEGQLDFEELDIVSPMVFDGSKARALRFELDAKDGSFRIESRLRLSPDDWTLHATGRILRSSGYFGVAQLPRPTLGTRVVGRETHYKMTAELGLVYGPTFQGFREATVVDNFLQAELEYDDDLTEDGYFIHPALLDVCYQSLVDFPHIDIGADAGMALLPVKIGRFQYHRSGKFVRLRARLTRRSPRSVLADFELFDAADTLLVSLSECRFRAAPLARKDQEKISCWRLDPWLCPHPSDALLGEQFSSSNIVDVIRAETAQQATFRESWLKEALPLLEAFVVSCAFEAFRSISQKHADALTGLASTRDPYTRWLSSLLQQEGLLLAREGEWRLAESDSRPGSEEIWRTLEREHSDLLPQLVLMGRIRSHLAHLLIDPSSRPDFIATLRGLPITESRYHSDPAYAGTRHLVELLLRIAARDWPTHRRLRVLEVSSGPSEIWRSLLSELPEDRLDYVLALPEAVVERQQAELADFNNLALATLDYFNWRLTTERSLPERFDVVILGHSLHQAANPKFALSQVRQWLAADAVLLIDERHPDWSATFVAGLDNDWWHEAGEGEAPRPSLRPVDDWGAILRAEGFLDVQQIQEHASEGYSEGTFVVFARAPVTSALTLPKPEPASWVLLVDPVSSELAEKLSARLATQGQDVETVDHLPQDLTGIHHVVQLIGWGGSPEAASSLLTTSLSCVQSLAAHSKQPPRLWVVTQGAFLGQEVSATRPLNPQQSAIWGFSRVVMNEYPDLMCTLIDVGFEGDLGGLENELLHPDGESEILLRPNGRYSLRMREIPGNEIGSSAHCTRYRLDFLLPGQLRNLVWVPLEGKACVDDVIEVKVQATGLNFRDVMYLMGLLPDEAVENGFAGASLGLEFAGIVSRVGPKVRNFSVGDRVMGFGSACFASHVITRSDALARIPEGWSFESAATVPTVFFTVYYALKYLANLGSGERVLIHGGAGGVGIAAIQLAKYLGAEVYVTVGGHEKRDFVRLLGADHVFDSRTLAFADEILALTEGEGVDVVLNSLAGEAMRRNFALLKPFGRYIELGKRDFFENTTIGLRPFKNNVTYFGVDADQLLIVRPKLATRMFHEVMALFREGVLTPLPFRVFSSERVIEAFRFMQQARHIGKIVVAISETPPLIKRQTISEQLLQFEKNSTWIVTGGFSGFGLESARWLAERGVGHLVLVGRRGLNTPGAAEAIDEFSKNGIHVRAMSCDVSDSDAVEKMVEMTRDSFPPIKGVLHAAAVFEDSLLKNLDAESIDAVVAPKLLGAWNLHRATLGLPLEHFVLYSSITTAIGNPGQANYVAANAGLEGLAEMRRQLGLPAVCVSWGPIGDAGYLFRNEMVRNSLEARLGKSPLSSQQALNQLGRVLYQGHSQAVANFDWNILSRLLPSATRGRFEVLNRSLKKMEVSDQELSIQMLLKEMSPEEAVGIIEKWVVAEVAKILSISVERIDPARNLHDLGLDSLMAVELAMGLEQRVGIQIPVMVLNDSPTAEKVAKGIVKQLLKGDIADPISEPSDLEAVEGWITKHGESLTAEEIKAVVEDTRSLREKGARFTP